MRVNFFLLLPLLEKKAAEEAIRFDIAQYKLNMFNYGILFFSQFSINCILIEIQLF